MFGKLLPAIVFLGVLGLAAPAAAAQTGDHDCDVDEQQIRIRYSLYFENYRAGNFEAALPDLEWIIACAPGFGGHRHDARNFRRAVEVHETLAERTDDPVQKRRHLERALALIEKAVPTLQDAGAEVSEHEWLLRKGSFLQTHEAHFPDRRADVCASYEQAFAMDPAGTAEFFLKVIAFCRAEDAIADGSADARRDTRAFLEETLLNHAEDPEVREYIQSQAERLITTPREEFAFLYERYREVGLQGLSDEEIDRLFTLNQQAGEQFFSSEAAARALRRELLPHVVEMDPSFARLTILANVYMQEGDLEQAVSLFERALEVAENPDQERDTYYNIAVVLQQRNQFASAANHLREALRIDGNHGESLFLMGSLIQQSIRGTDLQSRAAFWCAADYFSRAAARGVANASAAAQSALRGAPTPEEYFFQGWRPGQTVTASYGWGTCQARVR